MCYIRLPTFDSTTDCLQIIMEKASIQRISKATDNSTTVDTAAATTTPTTETNAAAAATVTILPYASSLSQYSATKLSSEKKCTYVHINV